MNAMKAFARGALVFGIAVTNAVFAFAQGAPTRSERPYRGLFGSGVADAEQVLSVNASVGAGYDTNYLLDPEFRGTSGIGPVPATESHPYGYLAGGLTYAMNRTRGSLQASLQTSGRYFNSSQSDFIGMYGGSVGGAVSLTRKDRVSGSYSVTRQPYTFLPFTPALFDSELGIVGTPDQSVGIARENYVTQSAFAAYRREIGRRVSFELNGAYTTNQFSGTNGLSTRMGGARFHYGLTKGLGLRLGYSYTEGRLAGSGERAIVNHGIDAGIDFSRNLSFSRRTTFSMSTGSSVISDRDRSYVRVIGDARLNREIGRTWNATLAYNRGIGFVERFNEPIFSDAVTAGFGGLINRRVRFTSSAGLSVGDVGLTGNGSAFSTFNGLAGVHTALTRHLAFAVDYSYYRYRFDRQDVLPSGYLNDLNRHDLRAYITMWAPLLSRGKRSDASR